MTEAEVRQVLADTSLLKETPETIEQAKLLRLLSRLIAERKLPSQIAESIVRPLLYLNEEQQEAFARGERGRVEDWLRRKAQEHRR